jgi:hypothetical protein
MPNIVKVRLYSSNPAVYTDVTSSVLNLTINRGKNRQLDSYEPGNTTITFKNNDRLFDPTNTSSALYGYIKPKQRVEVFLDTGSVTKTLFIGLVDEWMFNYDISGESVAVLSASDRLSLFANQYLQAQIFPEEKSGARVNRILDNVNVAWGASRSVDAGIKTLAAEDIAANTSVLDYLHRVETAEQGQIFVVGDTLVFEDSNNGPSSVGGYPTFADNNSGYFYDSIDVSYSSDLLYNEVVANSWDGVASSTAVLSASQTSYGVYMLTLDDVLFSDQASLDNLSIYLAYKYQEPKYRFNSIRINYFALTAGQQYTLDSLIGLNSFGVVIYTPNRTGSAIQKYVRIIGIEHDVQPDNHLVTLKFESIDNPNFTLNDTNFGILDTSPLGY